MFGCVFPTKNKAENCSLNSLFDVQTNKNIVLDQMQMKGKPAYYMH